MNQLIYHNLQEQPGQTSPFDEAVMKVARSGAIDIVSPYIGIGYIERIILHNAGAGWRLVSDVEAWLSSLPVRSRSRAWLFIRDNLDSIHHCSAIHAKAVIGHDIAMFGSANLTTMGMLGRNELSILIDERSMVAELGGWFNTLWSQTQPPVVDEASAFIQWLDEEAGRAPARRDKISLSTASRKIRARLAKLPMPEEPRQPATALNLDTVAQTLIIQEELHYASLDEALEAAIDTLANAEFTLGAIVDTIRKKFMQATVREIYFGLLQHCANHVRSVFSENTRNRLILKDGQFTQSSIETINEVLAPFDSFLAYLIHHLDFIEARDLPDEGEVANATGMDGAKQTILLSELIDCSFLEIEDIAGHLPRYNLSEVFEWVGRYTLFTHAMHDWVAKKAWSDRHAGEVKQALVPDTDSVDVEHSASGIDTELDVDDIDDIAMLETGMDHNSLATYLRMEKEEQIKAERDYRRMVDLISAHLLEMLFKGEKLPQRKDLVHRLSIDLGAKPKLVRKIISDGAVDFPRIVVFHDGIASINPLIDWKDLNDFPLTQKACKDFLEQPALRRVESNSN